MFDPEYDLFVHKANKDIYDYIWINLMKPASISDIKLAEILCDGPGPNQYKIKSKYTLINNCSHGRNQPSMEDAQTIVDFAKTLGITLDINRLHEDRNIRARRFQFSKNIGGQIVTMRGHILNETKH